MVGEPLEVGAQNVRPVVRVSGRRRAGGDASAGGAGVWLRAEPAGVMVLESDGRERHVATPDATRLILRGLVGAALAVAVASEAVARILR